MRVLGIDPSSRATGFGIVDHTAGESTLVAQGVVRPARSLSFSHKINVLRQEIDRLLTEYRPDEVAIENPFSARNVRTALTLGQVRGAILVAVASRRLPLFEYSPLEIKKAVTGYGQADKVQVQSMIRSLLAIPSDLDTDASDALATALCHLQTRLFQKKVEEAKARESG